MSDVLCCVLTTILFTLSLGLFLVSRRWSPKDKKGAKKKVYGKLAVFLAIATLLVGMGVWQRISSQNNSEEYVHLRSVNTMSTTALKGLQPGDEVLFDGYISPETRHDEHNLVAYVYEEYEHGEDSGWEVRRREKYPLIVKIGGQDEVNVINTNYKVIDMPTVWHQGDHRYKGLVLNDPVFVIGALDQNSDGISVQAREIIRGDKSTYMAHLREQATTSYGYSLLLWGAGGVVALIGATWSLYDWLLILVPEPAMSISPQPLQLGQQAKVAWRFSEERDKFKRFVVELHGREWAENTSGTSTSRYKREFIRHTLADVKAPDDITTGQCKLKIPVSFPPSFNGAHNRVEWFLQTRTYMKWRPVPKRTVDIELLPPPVDPALSKDELARFGQIPPNSAIQIAGGRTHFLPGEEIHGLVRWRLQDPDDSVVLRLLWATEGKGDHEEHVVYRQRFNAPQMEDQREFHITLPQDGPPSFSGKYITLSWILELAFTSATQKKHFLSSKPKVHREQLTILLSPTGQEFSV